MRKYLPGWFQVSIGQVDGSILETGGDISRVDDHRGGRELEELGDVVQHGEDGHGDHKCPGGVDLPGTKSIIELRDTAIQSHGAQVRLGLH